MVNSFLKNLLDNIGNFFNGILNSSLDFLFFLLDFFFGWINLPQMDSTILNSVNSFLDLIFNNLSLLGFFVRPGTLKVLIPLLVLILNFKYIYKILMWFLRKLPFLNIK